MESDRLQAVSAERTEKTSESKEEIPKDREGGIKPIGSLSERTEKHSGRLANSRRGEPGPQPVLDAAATH
jgi:hypothetical protein